MKSSGRGGKGVDGQTAYRIASLMREPDSPIRSTDTSSLRRLTRDIEGFLEFAPHVPPVVMETEAVEPQRAGRVKDEEYGDSECPVVELNVVAGVLEEKSRTGDNVNCVQDVLLPTARTTAELDRRRADEAQAMLNLLGALSGRRTGLQTSSSPTSTSAMHGRLAQTGLLTRTEVGDGDEKEEEEDGVVVMDADDLANEDSSEDEECTHPPRRRRVVELN